MPAHARSALVLLARLVPLQQYAVGRARAALSLLCPTVQLSAHTTLMCEHSESRTRACARERVLSFPSLREKEVIKGRTVRQPPEFRCSQVSYFDSKSRTARTAPEALEAEFEIFTYIA